MRGRPEHIEEVEALVEKCSDIEDHLGDLPAPHCSILRMSTDDLVIHLRVSWVVERLHRAKLASGDDRLQNAADAVAARDELNRRLHAPPRHPSIAGPGR